MKNNINELYENINEIERLNLLCPSLYYGNVDKYTESLLASDIADCMSVLQDFYYKVSTKISNLFNNVEWFGVEKLDDNKLRFIFINDITGNLFNIDLSYDELVQLN